MRRLLETLLIQPAAAVVSGLPLITKPIKMRMRLMRDAFDLMLPGAPFVQFTYSVASPVPKRLRRLHGGSLRAHLDEYSAGAGVGVSEDLASAVIAAKAEIR